ncbi:hypothetical protein MPTK1_2g19040 [Marchantia polymorpha subsp. ruderalis]|uniref:Uncharacterized protein n=1 Tax=Marchantia polymorpha TaxID=3197 RepID=A0A2R6W8K3_MARPO|nr:hypothetical protein MARPO_0128s0019 [Marchantia polymorpha]BBN02893.1 hypothetical protein Mp_2g19040 [Marchantia polymorpha subsp. ruderalis]|eukprot:PTQ30196.1 hypothetical protein MARPO_0128s0019 [Marchantia polymorpha]
MPPVFSSSQNLSKCFARSFFQYITQNWIMDDGSGKYLGALLEEHSIFDECPPSPLKEIIVSRTSQVVLVSLRCWPH